MKTCKKCGESKHEDYFYTQNKRWKSNFCKECHREKCKESFRKYRKTEKYKNYLKKYKKTNSFKEVRKRSEKKFPEKNKARRALLYKIRVGKIKRLPCQICGKIKSQAHHRDYSKPFDIIWLCVEHHHKLHDYDENIIQQLLEIVNSDL